MKGIRLVATGLAAQVVGVSTQALWHTLLAGSESGLLTEDRTFLIDHTISNAGVAAMVVGACRLHREQPCLGSRIVATGTGLEVVGALGDLLGHVRGGESPFAFASIGAGFVTAAVGVLVTHRSQAGRGARQSTAPSPTAWHGRTRRSRAGRA